MMLAIAVLVSADATEPPVATLEEFGKNVELAPLVVKGKPLSLSIYARNQSDRRYAGKLADEVIEIAYETMGDSTGHGLVIVGAKGEPHPLLFFRRFIARAEAGELDPSLTPVAAELTDALAKLQARFKMDDEEAVRVGLTFDTFLPALPMPLAGTASPLYQLAWAEGFDEARLERKLQTLTRDDLRADALARYDWVFYLPPQSATGPVLKDVLRKGMQAQKMGVLKRAAVRTAVFTFKPAVNKAVETMRSAFLFATILRAESGYSDDDVDALTRAYAREMMPNFKPDFGNERERVLAAIEKQKVANTQYAKDPFVSPARLREFDAEDYVGGVGDYSAEAPRITHRFLRDGDRFYWQYRDRPPLELYPAGERLLVNERGDLTIRLLVDDTGAVIGIEERRVRWRQTVSKTNG